MLSKTITGAEKHALNSTITLSFHFFFLFLGETWHSLLYEWLQKYSLIVTYIQIHQKQYLLYLQLLAQDVVYSGTSPTTHPISLLSIYGQ